MWAKDIFGRFTFVSGLVESVLGVVSAAGELDDSRKLPAPPRPVEIYINMFIKPHRRPEVSRHLFWSCVSSSRYAWWCIRECRGGTKIGANITQATAP